MIFIKNLLRFCVCNSMCLQVTHLFPFQQLCHVADSPLLATVMPPTGNHGPATPCHNSISLCCLPWQLALLDDPGSLFNEDFGLVCRLGCDRVRLLFAIWLTVILTFTLFPNYAPYAPWICCSATGLNPRTILRLIGLLYADHSPMDYTVPSAHLQANQ